ncbi:SRPBCC domain-containing protein [Nocardioides sp. 1609]|uniref:SRPBCC family protein n=1 Tax=Nocardioides sp. 1609 TaxID=2508327 RepID=UPI00107040C5|nr:SRPBCC domain-containing protein [Nocardioides sp. 1609]
MSEHALHLDRTVDASPATVWAAWTTSEGLAGWWWSHWPGTTYDVDARTGGRYRIEAPEAGVGVTGEYVELDAPRRLVQTWEWLDDGVPGVTDRIEVTLTAEGAGTRVDVVHVGPGMDADSRADYASGWAFVLDALVGTHGT